MGFHLITLPDLNVRTPFLLLEGPDDPGKPPAGNYSPGQLEDLLQP